ncbi:3074_t:CDS:1 [Racocetra fulgida]|uniref:3074_t:CDS:1 n=1 Tax=Racocetra fulgida TaxID=60492 RepID=A0A9N9FJ67_9GLOM|nr:3074_t:CDS:1 [Racocetra fulgida]
MSQIRSNILFNRNNQKTNNQQIQNSHIATPILYDSEENEIEPNENISVSNFEDEENTNIQFSEIDVDESIDESITEEENQWIAIINQWIEATRYENQVGDTRDQIFLDNELKEDFNLAGRNIHPADDTSGKWDLITLFVDNLEPPVYLTQITN